MKQFKIYYTSDVHGYLFPTDYIKDGQQPLGLINVVANYRKDHNTIIIDGGDMYQGSPLLQYLEKHHDIDAVTVAMNMAGYDYVTLGNHDFNFGYHQLQQHLNDLDATVIAENVTDLDGQTLYPAQIKTLENGTSVGLIGLVTDYINIWEKPAHLEGIKIESPLVKAAAAIAKLRETVDVVIGVYHGGYERDLTTGQVISDSTENIAWQLTDVLDLDILLTGHQHGNVQPQVINDVLTLQMPNQAKLFAEITGDEIDGKWQFNAVTKSAGLVSQESIKRRLQPLQKRVEAWLDQPITELSHAVKAESPLYLAQHGNAILQWIANVQLLSSGADITLVSLNNNPSNLPKNLTLRRILQNYPFDNTLVTKRVTGHDLRVSLEHTAQYFTLIDDQLAINPKWLVPKVEHYNYDLAFGIDYAFDISQSIGQRVSKLQYRGVEVQDKDVFTIAMNNYRAVGGGNYTEYRSSETITTGDQSIQEMLIAFFKTHAQLPESPKLQLHVK
ncbi:bifunctional metallophosphatase/5'-nucleotidase [Leuconostoc rapi]|uniref:bifunctional metallophosphatase/5'-nucleotidase n=1 Tax=Leuconostoc rapi TaxID=1406906 RepID=UPI0019581D6A|nr:bifunctional UDP-sugar hydrolase/5'-nucleotidase [Leuconostoc rapi]MBM7436446.1 2',3'-cyclic-nucleotide 2'-phosphodiesterase/3'-nucleotidase [Leuconostoc rapi]